MLDTVRKDSEVPRDGPSASDNAVGKFGNDTTTLVGVDRDVFGRLCFGIKQS